MRVRSDLFLENFVLLGIQKAILILLNIRSYGILYKRKTEPYSSVNSADLLARKSARTGSIQTNMIYSEPITIPYKK